MERQQYYTETFIRAFHLVKNLSVKFQHVQLAPYPYSFKEQIYMAFSDKKVLNAGVTINNKITVTEHLVEAVDDNLPAAVAVMAHEFGHIYYNHTSQNYHQLSNKANHNMELTADRFAARVLDILNLNREQASELFTIHLTGSVWPHPKSITRAKTILKHTKTGDFIA